MGDNWWLLWYFCGSRVHACLAVACMDAPCARMQWVLFTARGSSELKIYFFFELQMWMPIMHMTVFELCGSLSTTLNLTTCWVVYALWGLLDLTDVPTGFPCTSDSTFQQFPSKTSHMLLFFWFSHWQSPPSSYHHSIHLELKSHYYVCNVRRQSVVKSGLIVLALSTWLGLLLKYLLFTACKAFWQQLRHQRLLTAGMLPGIPTMPAGSHNYH